MQENTGWKCPTCSTVWAPTQKFCEKCDVKEDKSQGQQHLLLETGGVPPLTHWWTTSKW